MNTQPSAYVRHELRALTLTHIYTISNDLFTVPTTVFKVEHNHALLSISADG